jgi:hypothetical protein
LEFANDAKKINNGALLDYPIHQNRFKEMIEKNFYKHDKEKETGDSRYLTAKKVVVTELPSTRLVDKIFDRFNIDPVDKNCILAHEFLVAMIVICHITNNVKI